MRWIRKRLTPSVPADEVSMVRDPNRSGAPRIPHMRPPIEDFGVIAHPTHLLKMDLASKEFKKKIKKIYEHWAKS